jgi:hypothetical protein
LFTLKQARTKTAAFVEKAHGRIEKRTIELALGLEGHRPFLSFSIGPGWPRPSK